MIHAQKRLASTAARLASTVSSTTVQRFPPKEALFVHGKHISEGTFDIDAWTATQPPPTSALSAFAHRIGLGESLSPEQVLLSCTHSSFIPFHRQHRPKEPEPRSNAQLSSIGNGLMGLFASEYIAASYPYLPTRVLKAAVTAYVGPLTCASVANEIGATSLLRWRRSPTSLSKPAVLHTDALASIPRSIVALVSQKHSLLSARKLVHSFFLTREVDLRSMVKFRDPKTALLEMVSKLGKERPRSRLLKETGRFSNSPVFVVGIFSGADQIGEGFGSSLKMAEFRAAEDALHRVYLTRTPSEQLQLPTSTLQEGLEGQYTPPDLGMSEIMYASSGHSTAATLHSDV